MYTQCSHCRAIFRVTMKELTAAQGLLRCSECDTIFDAMKSLSTTLPDEHGTGASPTPTSAKSAPPIKVLPIDAAKNKKAASNSNTEKSSKKSPSSRKLLYFSLLILGLVLALQLLYTFRDTLLSHPAASGFKQSLCQVISCNTDAQRDVEQIKMLSHNVYSHPNSPQTLIISASIQNNAPFAQAYPIVEVSFLDKKSSVVALSRFTPAEYLGSEQANALMPPNTPREFSVNIADPGKDAIRFQFRFL